MRNLKLMLFFLALHTSNQLTAEIGCMANSHKLKEKMDLKELYYVQCTCDCARYKIQAKQAICTQCQHSHMPRAFEVITGNTAKQASVKKGHKPGKGLPRHIFSYN